MASTPPKRNFSSKRGMKKQRYPFAPSKEQSGLGSAYNSTSDPRGPDAYVPVPDSRGATQSPNRGRSSQSKRPIGGYRKGSTFLDYKLPSGPRGDSPSRGRNEGGREQDMRDATAPYGRYPNGNVRRGPKRIKRKSGDGWIG